MQRGLARMAAIVALTLTVVLVAGTIALPAGAVTPTKRERMLAWANQARDAHGTRALETGYRVWSIARDHSLSMSRTRDLYHSTNLSTKLSFVSWSTYGENVGVGVDPEGLFRAFMHSDPHRRNILNRDFRKVGIAFAREDGMLWVTMIFFG